MTVYMSSVVVVFLFSNVNNYSIDWRKTANDSNGSNKLATGLMKRARFVASADKAFRTVFET